MVPESVEVRRCTDADAAAIATSAGADYVRGAMRRQHEGRTDFLVAMNDDRCVGSGELAAGDPPELKNLSVDAEFRGTGIGTALIAAAERIVDKRAGSEPRRLVVGVGLDNPRAAALYERLGYERTGVISTTAYEYVDDHGVTRTATETDEERIKIW